MSSPRKDDASAGGLPRAIANLRRDRLAATIVLAALVAVTFWPVLGNAFTNYDDPVYVTRNPHVRPGLDASELRWALSATRASNWHPLTWISHMLDCELYGLAPWGHHLSSLLLHLASTLLLFFTLARMTGSTGRSAFAAALFGIHPLRVESVAWIAERKDVLSAFLWMLTLSAYVSWSRTPTTGRRLAVIAVFAAGLASKPMLVTLPFTLLLLDFWPLGRWQPTAEGRRPRRIPWGLVREKTPLFALAAASSVVTFLVQRSGNAVRTMEQYPLASRIPNALVTYVAYLWKMVRPIGLAAFYPHPRTLPPFWEVAGTALTLLLITALAVRGRRVRPYALVGWLWYVGTLVPVIGLVQVGGQAMADRYTYLPLVGIFVAVAWGAHDAIDALAPRMRGSVGLGARLGGSWVAMPAGAVVLALAACAHVQAGTWKDSVTLFEHALAVTRDNDVAHNNLGLALVEQGRAREAVGHYEEALRVRPQDARVENNLAVALDALGRGAEAREHYARALAIDPGCSEAHYNRGLALSKEGRLGEAVREYESALRADPEDPEVHNNLGSALARQGKVDEAIEHFAVALRGWPDYALAHGNLAGALFVRGRLAEAWAEIRKARRYGFEPPPELVRALSRKLPDPGGG
ncbi:MAG: tetratricopeptide repeat protein [Acidobacteriia bacterium]|nr:tetratricopeptide repeat protein [Terriglobia bacterium]